MKLRTLLFSFILLLSLDLSAQLSNYAILPYNTGFESGLDANWYTQTSAPGGRIRPHLTGSLTWSTFTAVSHTGQYFLGLDDSIGGTFHTQEAWMGLNLAGAQNVSLNFWFSDWNDENHPQDGIFFSDNGGTSFTKVLDLNGQSYTDLQWYNFTLNIDSVCQVHSLTKSPTFVVKFQQHDNFYFAGGNDGFLFDDIAVTGLNPSCQNDSIPPTALCQNLTLQLPAVGLDTLSANAVDDGSSDNCFINSYVLSQEVFTCADIGPNPITLTTTDLSGNSSNCSATVMVMDSSGATTLPVNLGGSQDICIGTTITLDAGFPGSTYSWSNGDLTQTSSVAGGSYQVLVTDSNGCTGTDSVNITELTVTPSNPVAVGGPPIICTGQSVTVTADSGYVSYVWITGTTNQSVTVQNGGFLSVTVTDSNQCSRVDSIEITQVNAPPPSTDVLPAGPVYVCDSGDATLNAASGLSTYLWNTGATTSSVTVGPGAYTLTVTGPNGCQNISAAATEVRDTSATPPTLAVNGAGDSICASPASSYNWLLNGTPLNLTTQCISATVNGMYTCEITDANGCNADASTSFMVGLKDDLAAWEFSLAPNPFQGSTRISFTPPFATEVTVDVYSLDGRLIDSIFSEPVSGGVAVGIDFQARPGMVNGTYLYRVYTAEGISFSGRMLLAR